MSQPCRSLGKGGAGAAGRVWDSCTEVAAFELVYTDKWTFVSWIRNERGNEQEKSVTASALGRAVQKQTSFITQQVTA